MNTINEQNTSLGHYSSDFKYLDKSQTLIAAGFNDSDRVLLEYLKNIGYIIELYPTTDGIKELVSYQIPNVLLLDIDYLKESAIHLTKRLKDSPLTYTMPIIIVVGSRNLEQELLCLEVGAEDYIAKPVHPELLAARIVNCTRRNIRLQVSNPLTGLPGTIYIEEQTSKRLDEIIPTAMCYVDVVDFKAFNDKYGYSRGDIVIKLLANMLNEVVNAHCGPGDFVGHIGGDDFVVIIKPDQVENVSKYVIDCFDTLIPFQYDLNDMSNGYILAKNRQGEDMKFPLMTVTIGVVTNTSRVIESYLTMTELAAEMKNYCKAIIKNAKERKSIYRIDQRTR